MAAAVCTADMNGTVPLPAAEGDSFIFRMRHTHLALSSCKNTCLRENTMTLLPFFEQNDDFFKIDLTTML